MKKRFFACMVSFAVSGSVFLLAGCTGLQQKAQANVMVLFEQQTGLKPVTVPGTEKEYLGKTHRGYEVLFHGEAGNVWGRYAARVAMGEIGRESGGVLAFLTRSQEYGTGPAGSILDRLLAKAIGQPLSITMILKHGKTSVPRLDILSPYSNIKPEDGLPAVQKIGMAVGSIHSKDKDFAMRLYGNAELIARIKKMRCQYIRVDGEFVTLFWAGQEDDYSAMIREFGDYFVMVNAFMDTLADIADAIPAGLRENR